MWLLLIWIVQHLTPLLSDKVNFPFFTMKEGKVREKNCLVSQIVAPNCGVGMGGKKQAKKSKKFGSRCWGLHAVDSSKTGTTLFIQHHAIQSLTKKGWIFNKRWGKKWIPLLELHHCSKIWSIKSEEKLNFWISQWVFCKIGPLRGSF